MEPYAGQQEDVGTKGGGREGSNSKVGFHARKRGGDSLCGLAGRGGRGGEYLVVQVLERGEGVRENPAVGLLTRGGILCSRHYCAIVGGGGGRGEGWSGGARAGGKGGLRVPATSSK